MNWRRLGAVALAVLALHALLLREMHDALAARVHGAPTRPAVVLQVRTMAHAEARRSDAAIVGVTPAAVPPPPAPPGTLITPALERRRSSTPPAAAPLPAALGDVPPAAMAPARTPKPEATATSPAAAAPDGGVVAGTVAAAAAGDLPIYRTRLPPAFAFGYELQRGASSGSGELRWQPQGDHYRARLGGSAGGAPLLAWDSTGGFDDAGIAPLRYTDRRRDRGTQAANFRRDARKVTFSGPAVRTSAAAGRTGPPELDAAARRHCRGRALARRAGRAGELSRRRRARRRRRLDLRPRRGGNPGLARGPRGHRAAAARARGAPTIRGRKCGWTRRATICRCAPGCPTRPTAMPCCSCCARYCSRLERAQA